jgi:secreted PhoX family phosphatase
MRISRRDLLRAGLAGLAAAVAPRFLGGCERDSAHRDIAGFPHRDLPAPPRLRSLIAELGELGDPDAEGVRVPPGFHARLIARTGQPVEGTGHVWHFFPDGGATFATEDGGWIYVSNSEIPGIGGAGAVRFDAGGRIVSAYPILERTQTNCAGGKTPWHTWLSCEEIDGGRVFECDPWGEVPAVVRPALGHFKHEAAAVDPVRAHVYLTEDESDGRLYRFVPDALAGGLPDLRAGRLEVAAVAADRGVTWLPVPDPLFTVGIPTRMQVPASTAFDGGEGIWYHEGVVYFTTKGDWKVWAYDVVAARLSTIYDGRALAGPVLTGVDNVTVSASGDVLVAEDGGTMDICAVLPDGRVKQLVQLVGHPGSEMAGPAFDPSGTRLYFSSQRAPGGGATYEVEGPFHERV